MAPLTRESEGAGQTNVAGGVPGGAKPQPVAVEIPISVNGARTLSGSDKREPFCENTQTVLVFGSGAVIRLTAAVGPGQLLFVTNEKSKKEVVCQVVKSKQSAAAGGYVELKFTEAAADFWGVRFPGAPTQAAPAAPPVVASAPSVVPPAKRLEEKLADLKTVTPAALVPEARTVVEPPPVVSIASPAPTAAPPAPATSSKETKLAPVVTMRAPSQSKIPTLSEFLTQGNNGLELTRDRSANPSPAAQQETTKEAPAEKLPVAAVPLPSAPKLRQNAPGLAAALGIQQNAAPGALSFDLAAEEVKIPSWLEPLARNSAIAESKAAEASPEIRSLTTPTEPSEASSVATSEPVGEEGQNESRLISAEGRAPNFGSSLALGTQSDTKSSGSGWKIAAAIVVAVLAGAAVWYWYVNQPAKVSASSNREAAEGGMESIPAPDPKPSAPPVSATSPVAVSAPESKPAGAMASGLNASPMSASSVASPARSAGSHAKEPATEEVANEPVKKPKLGEVHLAAPKVSRSTRAQENGMPDPGLMVGSTSTVEANSLALLSGKGKVPAAPVVIGGDVQPARLLSSVPPVYPQLARAQRISGDVTLDLLVDGKGNVSATRVISGSPLLHQAAAEAVKQWKYKPALLNGQPTSMHLIVTVQFRLQ